MCAMFPDLERFALALDGSKTNVLVVADIDVSQLHCTGRDAGPARGQRVQRGERRRAVGEACGLDLSLICRKQGQSFRRKFRWIAECVAIGYSDGVIWIAMH
jgi:hypothetical protein